MKHSRFAWPIALLAGMVLGAAAMRWLPSAGTASSPPDERAVPSQDVSPRTVEVAHVQPVLWPRSVAAVGSLRSKDAVMLRPEVAGRIAEILFDEGQPVSTGQPVVRLDDSVLRAQLQQAQASLDLAISHHRRASELSRQGFISAQARDEAASQLQVQRAAVALARAQLEKTTILAPFDGRVGLRNVSVGEYVGPGTDLVPLESIDPLQVDFRIPEQYLSQVQPGLKLVLRFDALPGVEREGAVDAISPAIDVAGRSLLLRANVANPDQLLRPGMFARVQLQFDETRVLSVPESALAPAGQAQYVFRVQDGRVARVQVEIGQRRMGQVEIVSGLNEGDAVVVSGIQKIADGQRVDAVLAEAGMASD